MTTTSWLLLAVLAVQLGLVGAGFYLKAYLVRKGENLATKEDVRELTRAVEEVKSEFLLRQEREKHLLARQLEEHRLSLTTELPIYRELWDGIRKLDAALMELQVAYGRESGGADVERLRRDASLHFESEKQRFYEEMNRVKPFISPEVHSALFLAFIVVRRIAAENQVVLQGTGPGRHQAISDGIAKTSDAFQKLSTAIRNRLYPGSVSQDSQASEGAT